MSISKPTNGEVILLHKERYSGDHNRPALLLCEKYGKDPLLALVNALRMKITRTQVKSQNLRGKRLEKFYNEPFDFPKIKSSTVVIPEESSSSPPSVQLPTSPLHEVPPAPNQMPTSPLHEAPPASTDRSDWKTNNLLEYEICKKQRFLNSIKSQITKAQHELSNLNKSKTYLSRKYVHQRENSLKSTIDALRKRIKNITTVSTRTKGNQTEMCGNELGAMKHKYRQMQKSKSALKVNASNYNCKSKKVERYKDENQKLKSELVEIKNETLVHPMETVSFFDGYEYTEEMRMCIFDLLALDVASDKVGEVIDCVTKRLFNIKIKKLPSRSTTLRVADEAHYLTKLYYTHKIKDINNLGIKKDGTSRKKIKILDTSLTLDSGDVLPLGYKRTARETAQAITDNTKAELQELNEIYSHAHDNADKDIFLPVLLDKLSYIMTDRAANEKKSNMQIVEWVQNALTARGLPETVIHSMNCMVHVLLGFHRGAVEETMSLQIEIIANGEKLGRDAVAAYAFFKPEAVSSRAVRMASELLGPNGDEKCGIQGYWRAHCRLKNLKSLIGDYRDNRFNGLFEGSAQVLHHLDSILEMEKKLENGGNLKVKSLMHDLKDKRVLSILSAHAVAYTAITNPFWNLMLAQDTVYLELYKYIQPLHHNIRMAIQHPEILLQESFLPFPNANLNLTNPLCVAAFKPIVAERNLLLQAISSLMKGFLKCMENQLKDFLSGGIYSRPPAPVEVHRTKGSGADNLTSERHFGTLDASQKRRRHATLHFHTTSLMLKACGQDVCEWLSVLPVGERGRLWSKAKHGGKWLREKHQQEEELQMGNEEKFLRDTEAAVEKKKHKQGKKAVKRTVKMLDLPSQDNIRVDMWVAVAYENGWFPGVVLSTEENMFEIDFMEPGLKSGIYKWPLKPDSAVIDAQYIFHQIQSPPVPTHGGRYFTLGDAASIQSIYLKYKALYF